MVQESEWPFKGNSTARDLRWQVIELLLPLLPKPNNFATAMGRGMRKLRLENELAEYDLLHRLHRGRAASLDELVCAGNLLISSRKGLLPATVSPLDEELLVNPQSFDLLAGWVEDRLQASR